MAPNSIDVKLIKTRGLCVKWAFYASERQLETIDRETEKDTY